MCLINEVNNKIYNYIKNDDYGDRPEYLILTNGKFDILSWECRSEYNENTEPSDGFIATYNGVPVINGDKCLIL